MPPPARPSLKLVELIFDDERVYVNPEAIVLIRPLMHGNAEDGTPIMNHDDSIWEVTLSDGNKGIHMRRDQLMPLLNNEEVIQSVIVQDATGV